MSQNANGPSTGARVVLGARTGAETAVEGTAFLADAVETSGTVVDGATADAPVVAPSIDVEPAPSDEGALTPFGSPHAATTSATATMRRRTRPMPM